MKALALYSLNEYEKVIKCLNDSLRIDRNSSVSHYWLGRAWFKLEDYTKVLKCFDAAINIHNVAENFLWKGICFHKLASD